MSESKSFDKPRNRRMVFGSILAAITLAVAAFFGPWIWALVDIESDKRNEQQATEKFVAEMQNRSSFESLDAESNLLIERIAAAITELAPTVAFPDRPDSGLDNCLRYLTSGKRLNDRSQIGTRKIPDDAWHLIRDRIIVEAQALEITRIEVDDSTPRAQLLRLSDADDDFELTISNTNPQARAAISVSTDCHLPAAQLATPIRPTS